MAKLPSLWVLMLLFALSVGGSLAVYNMMSLFLVNDHHFTQESSSLILAVSRVAGLVLSFMSGFVSDRLGPRPTIRMVLLLTGVFTIFLGFLSGWLLIVVIILQGAVVASFFSDRIRRVSPNMHSTRPQPGAGFEHPGFNGGRRGACPGRHRIHGGQLLLRGGDSS